MSSDIEHSSLPISVARLGSSVVIVPTESWWDARGRLLAGGDECELFTFLRDMDPVFTLRFPDGSAVEVTVTPAGDRRFTLAEHTDPRRRQAGHRTGL